MKLVLMLLGLLIITSLLDDARALTIGRPHVCRIARTSVNYANVSATTKLSFLITAAGSVADPSVAETSGNPLIDAASLDCVRSWRYQPAVKDGKPVDTPWTALVAWNPKLPPALVSLVRGCARRALATATSSPAETEFAISYDGFKATSVAITRPSADSRIDQQEAACFGQPIFEEIAVVRTDERKPFDLSRARSIRIRISLEASTFAAEITPSSDGMPPSAVH